MHVYIVIRNSAYGDVVDKVFTIQSKAESYINDQTKDHPTFQYRIEHHWAI